MSTIYGIATTIYTDCYLGTGFTNHILEHLDSSKSCFKLNYIDYDGPILYMTGRNLGNATDIVNKILNDYSSIPLITSKGTEFKIRQINPNATTGLPIVLTKFSTEESSTRIETIDNLLSTYYPDNEIIKLEYREASIEKAGIEIIYEGGTQQQ